MFFFLIDKTSNAKLHFRTVWSNATYSPDSPVNILIESRSIYQTGTVPSKRETFYYISFECLCPDLKLFLLGFNRCWVVNQQAKIILLCFSLRKFCCYWSKILKRRNSVVRRNNEIISLFKRLPKLSMSPQSDHLFSRQNSTNCFLFSFNCKLSCFVSRLSFLSHTKQF